MTNRVIKSVHHYAYLIHKWSIYTEAFDLVLRKYPRSKLDFPYTKNEDIERRLIWKSCRIAESDYPVPFAVQLATSMTFAQAIYYAWYSYLERTNYPQNTFLDTEMRKKVLRPPGPGVGYLCLLVAQRVNISSYLHNEIATSKSMNPTLPFNSDFMKGALHIAITEDRFRIAMLLLHELGRLATINNVYLVTDEYFFIRLQDLLINYGIDDYNILMECTIQTPCWFPSPLSSSSLPSDLDSEDSSNGSFESKTILQEDGCEEAVFVVRWLEQESQ